MPKLLQINSTANWGSTGRIAEQIGERAIAAGWESYIAYGRKAQPSKSQLIKIGSRIGVLWHVLISRLFDLHGLASRIATKRLIKKIKAINPFASIRVIRGNKMFEVFFCFDEVTIVSIKISKKCFNNSSQIKF